ncbi:DUF4276 family protein [Paraburkholderia sp. LEh10]|uniref:DUF4276 family protein n=1 Tax=Paraburkholderia sp. LEh10 TaxID=2821353 RepID=UPI001AE766D1|nr:DUF4276 family protein [Paraburkholderia sp. LEh10]MBP0594575.1 DUF4276 family protein [Paraburkholderia sp. LEh10]
MPKGKVVFIVEGHLEQKFLTEVCNGESKVLKLQNGKTVAATAIAKQVKAQISIIRDPSYVVVLLDREKRPQSSIAFEKEIDAELKKLNFSVPFSVHVPDLMIENWILADVEALKRANLDVDLSKGTEGCHGKRKLDEAYRKKKKKYSEIFDGVPLLKSCSANTIKTVSTSFDRLFTSVSHILGDCYWLQR